jgi:hypothetical protein
MLQYQTIRHLIFKKNKSQTKGGDVHGSATTIKKTASHLISFINAVPSTRIALP